MKKIIDNNAVCHCDIAAAALVANLSVGSKSGPRAGSQGISAHSGNRDSRPKGKGRTPNFPMTSLPAGLDRLSRPFIIRLYPYILEAKISMLNLDLLEQIYDVALGESNWDDVSNRIREEFSIGQCALFIVDTRTESPYRLMSLTGGDDKLWKEYTEYYRMLDPWIPLFKSETWSKNTMQGGDRLIPYREFLMSEYYQDWWRPNDIYHTAGGRFHVQGNLFLQFVAPRPKQAGSYTDDELERLRRYTQHLVRAAKFEMALPKGMPQPDFDKFSIAYGLTSAEALLLEKLVETGSLKKSAVTLHRSYNTVRSQLQAIFQKTGAGSQVQLIRLVHQFSPVSIRETKVGLAAGICAKTR